MSTTAFTIANLDRLLPIQGVSYSPVPSDGEASPPSGFKYFDTDFTNSSFPLLWGTDNNGRGDIKNLAAMGVNFLHLYNWSVPPAPGSVPGDYQRDHLPFLAECAKHNVYVFVPVSNYFVGLIHDGQGTTAKANIAAMVAEVYSAKDANKKPAAVPGAGMWGVANEFDLNTKLFSVDDVATAMAYIVDAETALGVPAENLLPVTSPVSFAQPGTLAPGLKALQNLRTAVNANTTLGADFWANRMVASTNPFNDGSYLANYITTSFPGTFPDLPYFFGEMGSQILAGTPSANEAEQATFVAGQLAATRENGNFLGRCVFQFLDQTVLKSGTEATFGMNKFTAPPPVTPIPTGTIAPATYTPGGGGNV